MGDHRKSANLRSVAERVGLAPCSVSAVLNDTPAAKAIPEATKVRIFRAAAELNYCPNLWARSLRTKRTRMVAAVTPDFGRGGVAQVVAGLQRRLQEMGYLLSLTTIDVRDGAQLCSLCRQRGIEGIVTIDAGFPSEFDLPVASVDLEYGSSAEGDMRPWLTSIGESAADMIVRQIENQDSNRRTVVEAKMPLACFVGSSVDTIVDVRESA